MLDKVKAHYPNAVSSSDFISNIYKSMAGYGLAPDQILLAHSVCSDDVNNIEYPEKGRQMLGPFNLGGLNGYPFTGITGMTAFAHHVPEQGAAMIFYAPHIGINAEENTGKILRVGQNQDSTCCGATILALNRLKNNEIKTGSKPADDYQQHSLQEFLFNQKDRVLNSNDLVKEATDVIYEESGKMIDHMIQSTDFTGKYIFVVGAIIANTDWKFGSFVSLRRFEQWDIVSRKKIKDLYF